MTSGERITIGTCEAFRSEGRIQRGVRSVRVEPKVIDLLFALASRPGEVLSREQLMQAVWPGTTVGDDALAQCLFKLRKALGEDRYRIETIPKRGYRLIPTAPSSSHAAPGMRWPWPVAACLAVVAVLGGFGLRTPSSAAPATALLARADDSYTQFRRADNEAAIQLYQRVLAADPASARALAGLSNGLVQRALRWPDGTEPPPVAGSALKAALDSGWLRQPAQAATITQALLLARQAAGLTPEDPAALRALGLALSANHRIEEAVQIYDRALGIDPQNWTILVNRADLADIAGDPIFARKLLERAYAGMDRDYVAQPAQIRPWQARIGVEIAGRYEHAGDLAAARRWYTRTLRDDPAAQGVSARLRRLNGIVPTP